jgi:hypothetical protein
MACPTDQQVFWDGQNSSIVVSADPSTAAPIAATVGKNGKVDIQLEASFGCPVDVELSVFAPGFDPEDIFYMDPEGNMARLSEEALSEGAGNKGYGDRRDGDRGDGNKGNGNKGSCTKFRNVIFYKTNVLELNEEFSKEFPPGLYLLTLGVTPHDNENENFYRWVIYFIVP